MSFVSEFDALPLPALLREAREAGSAAVRESLARERLSLTDFARLISPAAGEMLETLARRSHALTLQRFGRVVRLFAPLYLSNECINNCKYCGFSRDNPILRVTLTLDEVKREARARPCSTRRPSRATRAVETLRPMPPSTPPLVSMVNSVTRPMTMYLTPRILPIFAAVLGSTRPPAPKFCSWRTLSIISRSTILNFFCANSSVMSMSVMPLPSSQLYLVHQRFWMEPSSKGRTAIKGDFSMP